MSIRPANIIRRQHTRGFTVICNEVLNDERLSLDEKGLLCWYLSRPHDWEVIPAHVRKLHRLGRDKLKRIMRTLRQFGYARLEIERADDGTIACVRYIITDDPAIPAVRGDVPAVMTDDPAIPAVRHEVPDGRVCEDDEADIDDDDDLDDENKAVDVASLQQTENPSPGANQETENPSDGLHVARLNNDIILNTPPTPQAEPKESPQEAIREGPNFKVLASKWPSDRIVSLSAAEKRFRRLSEDRKRAAMAGISAYLAESRARGRKICDLQTYLRERRWERGGGAPSSTAFAVRGGAPQAFRWLEYRRSQGEPTAFMEDCFRNGKPWYAPSEWPPPKRAGTAPLVASLADLDEFAREKTG